ncbi:uncharacterized protein VTP21DRAFT_689 [Calcarisporiella thermophila]|uniref:uncharacterized protein n=1 Tax=Calcarisporiella thermophila TaxID=911321 RepID=UPI003742580D
MLRKSSTVPLLDTRHMMDTHSDSYSNDNDDMKRSNVADGARHSLHSEIANGPDGEEKTIANTDSPLEDSIEGKSECILAEQAPNMDWRPRACQNECSIQVIDTSAEKIHYEPGLVNGSLSGFLKKKRPNWATMRWLTVDGVNWDVLKIISAHYGTTPLPNFSHELALTILPIIGFHPLAVEEVMHPPQRSKLEFYEEPRHFFLSLQMHALHSATPASALFSPCNKRNSLLSSSATEAYRAAREKFRVKKVHITLEHCYIFVLLKENTLITLFKTCGNMVTAPILSRLKRSKTLLRTSGDATLLLQAVLDAIVDHTIPIVEQYRHQIRDLEGRVLMRPKMKYTRELHIITGELILLKCSLTPTHALIQSLRDHEHISPIARTYLGNVLDHSAGVVEALEIMNKVAENLINLIFNTISNQSSEAMHTLSILNAIFLPLMFAAGVYGTNFTHFPELESPEGIWYFHRLCIIIVALTIFTLILLTWGRELGGILVKPPNRA